jgi:hypothetical protein
VAAVSSPSHYHVVIEKGPRHRPWHAQVWCAPRRRPTGAQSLRGLAGPRGHRSWQQSSTRWSRCFQDARPSFCSGEAVGRGGRVCVTPPRAHGHGLCCRHRTEGGPSRCHWEERGGATRHRAKRAAPPPLRRCLKKVGSSKAQRCFQ